MQHSDDEVSPHLNANFMQSYILCEGSMYVHKGKVVYLEASTAKMLRNMLTTAC